MHRDRTKRDRVVYFLNREDWTPFYVGKGQQARPGGHIIEAIKTNKNNHKLNIIREMGPDLARERTIVLATGLTDAEACAMEILLIAALGRADKGLGPLVNLTDGGDGQRGYIQSRQTKDRQRASLVTSHADPVVKTRRKLALADPSVRAKRRTAALTAYANPEIKARHRAALLASMEGKDISSQRRAKMAEPDVKIRHRAAVIAAMANPVVNQRLRDGIAAGHARRRAAKLQLE